MYPGLVCPEATVLPRAVMHDEEVYPSPFQFLPERYLVPEKSNGSTSDLAAINPDPRKFAFGYGRR
jgi:cytochrome P450